MPFQLLLENSRASYENSPLQQCTVKAENAESGQKNINKIIVNNW